jgi:hypothetical protein
MRAALNALASADAEWPTKHADPGWFERYGRRIEDQRLPKGREAREEYLRTVGADGIRLLGHLDAPYTPRSLRRLSEVEVRRFDQRLSDNRLAERHPYRCYAALSVGGFGSGELIGAFR